jgi:hypothetical protein
VNGSAAESGRTGLADAYLEAVARAFPVCSASDEFYFFPQALPGERDWSVWDDFSEGKIAAFADRLQGWEGEVRERTRAPGEETGLEDRLLVHSMKTLREQLTILRPHRNQPTFHLTVASLGLAEALQSPGEAAWRDRVATLPDFLDRARTSLGRLPVLFRDLGVEMAGRVGDWLEGLSRQGRDTKGAAGALERFEETLRSAECRDDFALSGEVLDLILRDHLGCGEGAAGLAGLLSDEIGEMEEVLRAETEKLAPGLSWQEAAASLPRSPEPRGGVVSLYREETVRLEEHCRSVGLVPHLEGEGGSLEVCTVPSFLTAVRASESYNALPGHPARGGTFFVFEGRDGAPAPAERSLEYRMTTAHETWPGHHLLDLARWNLPWPLRRSLERPLFYEGWACLAEELAARTGYFSGPWDRFILAKRRLRRAARGRADLGLQSGSMTPSSAAAGLEGAGFGSEEASGASRKYALRPGYQVCYTVGLRRFLTLLDGYGRDDLPAFAGTVLGEGEIAFEDLEGILRQRRRA